MTDLQQRHGLIDDVRHRWQLGRDGWRTVLANAAKEFKADEVSNLAAVVTLKIVLAVVPSLIAAVAIAAQVVSTDDINDLVDNLGTVIPGEAQAFVTSALETALDQLRENGPVALIISIGVGLLAASNAAGALVQALNKAFNLEEGRGFVGKRVTAFGVIGALAVSLIGMFVVIVLGPTLLRVLLPAEVLDSPLSILITMARYLGAITILMVFFGFAFWFGPNHERAPFRLLSPGAVLGVVGWLLLSWLFGLYVSLSQSYAATYGAFAGVIVLLVWLNYSFTVLLMGAELDHEIQMHLGEVDGRDTADAPAMAAPATTEPQALRPDVPLEEEPRPVAVTTRVPIPVGAARSTPGMSLAMRLWKRLAG